MKITDYPIGSPESRAAARAELERRQRQMLKNITVICFTGFPLVNAGGPPSEEILRSREFYEAPDGSIVQVGYNFYVEHGKKGMTIMLHQVWPDGEGYHGACRVHHLHEVFRLPRAPADAVQRLYARVQEKPVPPSR